MKLQLHNTAKKTIQPFTPVDDAVKLYTCGPTVYDYLHVGNWTAYIYWDILVRTLLAHGYTVHRTMNITDVGHLVSDADEGEDKLEKGARREGKTAWDIARYYTDDFLSGMDKFGLIPPDTIARATDFINEQLSLVRTLKSKGYTYQIGDGIYFDTAKFPSYSAFAGLDLDALKAGARIEYNREKRNTSDFALWKFTPKEQTRDMQWRTPPDLLDSPSNEEDAPMGFPGWHLECSAIAMHTLGTTLDIHTGGIDHIPVHHTNEIAQSEAATGVTFSRFWLHNNHMKVDGTKISKSLGNGFTLSDLRSRGYSPSDFRLLVLQSHYRSEANFSFAGLDSAKNRLHHWRGSAALRWQATEAGEDSVNYKLRRASTDILAALSNDLDTPSALKIIDQTFTVLEKTPTAHISKTALTEFIASVDQLLGVDLLATSPDIDDATKGILTERLNARSTGDWNLSDQLRNELLARGITVRDTAAGSMWQYK